MIIISLLVAASQCVQSSIRNSQSLKFLDWHRKSMKSFMVYISKALKKLESLPKKVCCAKSLILFSDYNFEKKESQELFASICRPEVVCGDKNFRDSRRSRWFSFCSIDFYYFIFSFSTRSTKNYIRYICQFYLTLLIGCSLTGLLHDSLCRVSRIVYLHILDVQ